MVESAHHALAELLVLQPTVIIAVAERYMALDTFPLDDSSGALESFAAILYERRISEITLKAGLTQQEVVEFAEALTLQPEDLMLHGGMQGELRNRHVENIRTRSGILPGESREGREPAKIYEEALELVEQGMRAVQLGLQMPVPEIRAVVADSLHSLIEDDSALVALAGIRSYDRYLSEHSVNVCILSMVLGRDLGLDPATTLELGISAMLHDVGKVFVPSQIVGKPGALTQEEWQQIRRHPVEGARALAGLPDLPALASTIALEHHLSADGSGYPSVPPDHKPHLLSRLVAVVDSYDALTTDRPYRARWTPKQAIAWMIYEAPERYDARLLARFAARAGLYPKGSLVRLCSGVYAVVTGGSPDHPQRPTLKIVADADGRDVEPATVDLSVVSDPSTEIDALAQPVEALLPYVRSVLAA